MYQSVSFSESLENLLITDASTQPATQPADHCEFLEYLLYADTSPQLLNHTLTDKYKSAQFNAFTLFVKRACKLGNPLFYIDFGRDTLRLEGETHQHGCSQWLMSRLDSAKLFLRPSWYSRRVVRETLGHCTWC